MYSLTDSEIDYILEDIQKHGVTAEDLQQDLLDHMCCLLEEEMYEGADFLEFYLNIRARFYTHSLKEIQEERDKLFIFKEYYAMKNTLKYTGLISAFLTITGALLKIFHLPGAGITILLGGLLFSLIFLPLMIALKFRDEEKTVDKWVFSIGFLLAMSITSGMIFKLMHWPFANILILVGLTGFIFGYIPIYYVTRIRRPELKFNTIINSVLMMACGGLLFAMYNMGYSKKAENANTEMLLRLERNSLRLEEKVLLNNSQVIDSSLKTEASTVLEKISSFQAELIAFMEEISIDKARKMSISAVKEPEELEHIKRYFSTVKGINSFNKMNEAVKQWNHATALRGKKPVELKKETMQASTYGNVLTHLTAIKQEILTQVLP